MGLEPRKEVLARKIGQKSINYINNSEKAFANLQPK